MKWLYMEQELLILKEIKMKKNMFILDLKEINEEFCGTLYVSLADLEKNIQDWQGKKIAEDEFGNFIYIDSEKRVILFMHEHEQENFLLYYTIQEFFENTVFSSLEEIINIIENEIQMNQKEDTDYDFFIEWYKAKVIIGNKINREYQVGDYYNMSAALRDNILTQEEYKKLEVFFPHYLKNKRRQ